MTYRGVCIVGCYTLDLYCKNEGDYPDGIHRFEEFPHQFTGQTFQECVRTARRRGWVLHKDDTATCPTCSGKPKQPQRTPVSMIDFMQNFVGTVPDKEN